MFEAEEKGGGGKEVLGGIYCAGSGRGEAGEKPMTCCMNPNIMVAIFSSCFLSCSRCLSSSVASMSLLFASLSSETSMNFRRIVAISEGASPTLRFLLTPVRSIYNIMNTDFKTAM